MAKISTISAAQQTGNDIKALGFKEGKIIGKILKDLENLVLDDPEKNKRDYLIDYIDKNYR